MPENNLTAIFAQSWMGGLFMGLEGPLPPEDEYIQCSDPECNCGDGGVYTPTTFYRLPDTIGESELLRELRCAQETGEIADKYKVHNVYAPGRYNGLSYLMKRDKDGVQYHPGRGLVAIRKRWAKEAGIKNVIPEAELKAAKATEHQVWMDEMSRRQAEIDERDILSQNDRERQAEIDELQAKADKAKD